MFWIENRHNEDIPQELLYPEWQTDKDKGGRTALMWWIIDCQGKDIPKKL